MLMDQLPNLQRKSDKLLLLKNPNLKLLRKKRLKPKVRRKCLKEKDVNGEEDRRKATVMGMDTTMVMDTVIDIDTAGPTQRRKEAQNPDLAIRRRNS